MQCLKGVISFEILAAVCTETIVWWNMTPHRLVDRYHSYGTLLPARCSSRFHLTTATHLPNYTMSHLGRLQTGRCGSNDCLDCFRFCMYMVQSNI